MPRGNGTGPDGYGPVTGRGLGFCVGNSLPGFMYDGPGGGRNLGRGFARAGRGRGFGYRNRFYSYPATAPGWDAPGYGYPGAYRGAAPVSSGEELDILKNRARYMKEDLDAMQSRIDELEKGESGE